MKPGSLYAGRPNQKAMFSYNMLTMSQHIMDNFPCPTTAMNKSDLTD